MQNQDFLPDPAPAAAPATSTADTPPLVSVDVGTPSGLGATQLIIAAAILLVLFAGLFFVRGGVKNALASSRATLDSANLAANAWFIFLMLLSGLVVFGLLGSLFGSMAYTAATAGLAVVGLAVCGALTGLARKTRK